MKGYLNKTKNGGIVTYNLHQQTDKPILYNVVELLPDTNISNLVEGQEVDFEIVTTSSSTYFDKKLAKLNQPTEVFYFEDWLIYMLNNSNYRENELMQFEEHYQNSLDYIENTDSFQKYFQEKLQQIDSKTELTDREIEDGAFEHFSHHSREYEYFIKACKWYRYQIKHKQ